MKLNKKFKVLSVGMLLVVTLVSAIGCSSNSGGEDTAYNQIDAAKTEELVGDAKETLVIDVRDAETYAKGHLTNAVNISFDEFEGKISELDHYKDRTVVLVCNSGGKSGEAAQMLVDNGFTKVYNVEEGMKGHDYETITYTNVIGSELEKSIAENKDAAVLDFRDAKDFDKKHAENAINMSIDDFETRISELKDKEQEIYLYCNTGNKSSKASQILEKNGYEKVYNSIDGTKEYEFGFTK